MIDKLWRRFFVHIDLYDNDLNDVDLFVERELEAFALTVVADDSGIQTLQSLMDERGSKFKQVAMERLKTGNFLCFCFSEKASGKAAYCRWLRKGSFYHDRFRREICLGEDEAFTMDSYTAHEFRGQGLHKEMNKRMLNYCKRELKLQRIFLVILRGREYAHLHKTVRELGYRRVQSRFYFRSDLVKALAGKLK